LKRTPAGLRAVIQRCLATEPDQRCQHAAEAEKILDLKLGTEDYVGMPFSPRQLRARLKTALRGKEYCFDG
jgi:CheY-like chemotaxis protein